jgi:eukaryotic-like serine/threonine-protein kinase
MIGQTIGNYRTLARLGGGGMGVVYSAEDTRLGRRVAVKFLSEEMARHPQALERFEREARAASALNHPNIATVYDVGTHEGRPYLVMELVEGQSLDQKTRERPLDIATLLDWAIQIADALDAAHAKGIVHRDVKPANLLVNARGQVKVLDFGLAKVAEPHSGAPQEPALLSAGPTVDDLLTSPGVAVGTVSYMSPEQARGEELDARSDLFSLGCVLYEMATGRRAFTGKTPAVVFHAILERTPARVREANPTLPAKLDEIIAKALEKDRDMRYQTAAELRGDLKRLKRDLDTGRSTAPSASGIASVVPSQPDSAPSAAPPASIPAASVPTLLPPDSAPGLWKRMLTPGGIARVVVLALAAVLGYRVLISSHAPGSKPAPNPEPAAPFSSLQVTRLTATGNVLGAAISRDGKYLAYSSLSGEGQVGLSVRQISTRSTIELLAPQMASLGSLAFSPDGSFIYYASQAWEKGGGYYQIPSLGGSPRLIVSGVQSNVALSFDGNRIAYTGMLPGEEKPALLVAGIGEKPEAPRAVLRNVDAHAIDDLAWSPDGRTLALLESHPDPSGLNSSLFTVSAAGGEPQQLSAKRWRVAKGGLVWLPDGSGLLFNAQERTGALAQVSYVSFPAGTARQLTSDLLNHINSLSVTGDGKAFVGIGVDQVSNIWTAPKGEAKSARQITSGREDGASTVWTPDGKIVYVSGVSGTWQLWLTDAQGSAPRQLTTDLTYHGWPTVCRGTNRVFYGSDSSGPMQLWSVGLEDGQIRQETNGDQQFLAADCAPDGSWFAGLTAPKGTTVFLSNSGKLTRLDRESGQMRTLFEEDAQAPAISPDGKHVAFLYGPAAAPGAAPGAQRIGIVPAAGGPLERSLDLPLSVGDTLRWTPDGHSVVYAVWRSNASNLWTQPLNGGKPKELTHFAEGRIFTFAWSRDGKTLALSRGSLSVDAVLFTSTR